MNQEDCSGQRKGDRAREDARGNVRTMTAFETPFSRSCREPDCAGLTPGFAIDMSWKES